MINRLLYLLCFLSILLAGCHSDQPKHEKTILRLNLSAEPPHLNPMRSGDILSNIVQFMLYSTLTKMDKDSTETLSIANHIDVTQEGRVYTFHLRDTQWSDGRPVTAYDFEYAWKLLLSPNYPGPNAYLLYPILNAQAVKMGDMDCSKLGIHAIDSKTLKIELETPCPYFLSLTSFCTLAPLPSHLAEGSSHWEQSMSEHLVSNGPFKLQSWKRGDQMILCKNPSYFNADSIHFDEIHISFVQNATSVLSLFEVNKLDFMGHLLTSLPSDCIPACKDKGILHSEPIASTQYFAFNTERFPFNNKHIRQAFSYAIDRKAIVDYVMQGGGEVAHDHIPPILKGGSDDLFPQQDVGLARSSFKKGLEELGVSEKDVGPIRVCYTTAHEANKKILEAIREQWSETLGVTVELEGHDWGYFLHKLHNSKDFQVIHTKWTTLFPDPMNILGKYTSRENSHNNSLWENDTYTEVINLAIHAKSLDERRALLLEAEKILVDGAPIATICHGKCNYLIRPDMEGVYISPMGTIHFENAKFISE